MEYENLSKEELTFELIQLKKCNNDLRKRFEQIEIALKESDEKLAQKATDKYLKLFNSIDQGFFVMDVIFDENVKPIDIYYVEANEASIKILGSDFSNKYLKDIIPNYESNWLEMFGEVAFTGKSVRMELYSETNKSWYSFYIFKIGDENSRTIGNIFLDITERKEYEHKLALQAAILSNVKDSILVVDENGVITYCNKAYVKLLGWQPQESIGRSIFYFVQYFVDDASKEKVLFYLGERQKTNSEVDEDYLAGTKCYSKDGTLIIADINRAVVKNSKGEFKGFVFSIRDVSEYYEYELKLKKSEEKYRSLYNSIDEGLAIIEVIFNYENKPENFRFIEFNPACEKQIGLIIKSSAGKSTKELKLEFDDFWSKTLSNVALTGESIRFVKEIKILNIWIDAYVFKIDLESGTKVGVLFNDTTVKIMHNQKLEELIKMQDELYVNVSHELKTPLNVIFSANQVMDMYLKSSSNEDRNDKLINYNNSIKQNCYRLAKLINNIVDLSKSNSGLLKLNLNNVNIVDVVESIVQSVSEYVKSKELKIIFDTNVEEKIIACDTDKIERVMFNLISNAIKFSNPNGEIFVNVLDKDSTVLISVKDTGRGIEKQNLDYIFNRFYQEDKSLSRKAEGSGIGLSLIKSLIDMHGGNISAESEINKGSTFKVELPAKTIERQEYIELANFMNDKIETIKIEFSDIYSIKDII